MRSAESRDRVLTRLLDQVPDDRPIALLNLLRFEKTVEWEGGTWTGRDLYERYVHAITPALLGAGGRPIFSADGETVLDGPLGERWDEVVIVRYPSRAAFESFLDSPELRAAETCREAALADARLIAVTAPRQFGRLRMALFTLLRKLTPGRS